MTGACGVEMNGPLAPFAGGAEEALASEGYSRQRARLLVGLMAEVSEWLGVGGLRVGDLSWEVIDEFFATRSPSRSRCRTVRSWQPIARYLQATGRATPPPGLAAGRTDAESEFSRTIDAGVWPSVGSLRPRRTSTSARRGVSRSVAARHAVCCRRS